MVPRGGSPRQQRVVQAGLFQAYGTDLTGPSRDHWLGMNLGLVGSLLSSEECL